MEKLIILSVLIMSMVIPGSMATKPQPKRALRRAQLLFVLFMVFWGYLCLHWYPALVQLK